MKNKIKGEMILTRCWALARMKIQGIVPKHQALDNELSAAYSTENRETNMTFQLVPPEDHCCNLAEREIQTYKDHFVGVLSGTVETFLLHLWYQVIPQAEP